MKLTFCAMFLLFTMSAAAQNTGEFDIKAAQRFANLSLACVHKEYPNHISHTLNSDADAAPPRKLTPAFYGCYDWHSSVHGHWLLVRLVRTFPDAPFVQTAREALRQSLTAENIVQEAAYLRGEGRSSFERPYGLAWLLQLVAELREWDDPQAKEMAANLHPVEEAALERLKNWLPKLSNPVRIGEHDQTAFALGLILDYAHGNGDQKFAELVVSRAKQFYLSDKNCPLAYEPSGEDFLSPCLGEADLMRRVLPSQEFARWLRTFMPQISTSGRDNWLQPVVSPDRSDPDRSAALRVPVNLRAGQREGDKCLRLAWRPDVPSPRDASGGPHRRRGGRCDGARAEPRCPAARHAAGMDERGHRDRRGRAAGPRSVHPAGLRGGRLGDAGRGAPRPPDQRVLRVQGRLGVQPSTRRNSRRVGRMVSKGKLYKDIAVQPDH